MRDLLSHREERQLTLIETLHYANAPMTIHELASALSCSARILSHDLTHIREHRSQLEIDSTPKGFTVHFHPNKGIASLYQAVMSESPGFQLLGALFRRGHASADELADELFVSPSTIHRLAKQVNRPLGERFQLTIETNPYRFSGDEVSVRAFFTQYFFDMHAMTDWPFPAIDEEAFGSVLRFFAEQVGIPLDYTRLWFFKLSAAVSLIRVRQGFRVMSLPFDTDELTALYEVIRYQEAFDTHARQLEAVAGTPVTQDLLIQLYASFVQKHFAFTYDDLTEQASLDPYTKASVSALEAMVDTLMHKASLTLQNRETFLLDMHNTFHLREMEAGAVSLLFDHKKAFCDVINSYFPVFYQDVERQLITWVNALGYRWEDVHGHHLIYTCFTHWRHLLKQLLAKQKFVSIIVLSPYDLQHADLLTDMIGHFYENIADIRAYEGDSLSADALAKTKADVIVTAFPLEDIPGKDVICVADLLSERDLEMIGRAVDQTRKRKIAAILEAQPR